jgi:hypothetical protein
MTNQEIFFRNNRFNFLKSWLNLLFMFDESNLLNILILVTKS